VLVSAPRRNNLLLLSNGRVRGKRKVRDDEGVIASTRGRVRSSDVAPIGARGSGLPKRRIGNPRGCPTMTIFHRVRWAAGAERNEVRVDQGWRSAVIDRRYKERTPQRGVPTRKTSCSRAVIFLSRAPVVR
jgi:hypothetical protein